MTLPNFIIIGSERSGTTSLYQYLRQHFDVFMSAVKETNFFAYEEGPADRPWDFGRDPFPVKTLDEYRALFQGCRDEKAIGEASPAYFFSRHAAERIHRVIPDVKLIAILRNPVERAHSAYRLQVTRGLERRTFDQALQDEAERCDESVLRRYRFPGLYHQHLGPYLELFDRSRIAFLLYDDLVVDAARLMRTLFEFLEVDPGFRPEVGTRYNSAHLPKKKILRGLFQPSLLKSAIKTAFPDWALRRAYAAAERLKGRSELEEELLREETRQSLLEEYRDDILRLQDLLDRDLSGWLEVSAQSVD